MAQYAEDDYPEDFVLTPRDSRKQRAIRSGYIGPKNNRGQPDTTGTDEIGVMIYPQNHVNYKQYSGQWKNGEFEGHGTVVYDNDDTYTGHFVNGKMHGRGYYTFPDGQVLDGEFSDDLIVRGKHVCPGYYTFQGNFVDGQMHKGIMKSDDGTEFEGTFETPTKRFGIFRYKNGNIFRGQFDLVEGGWKLNGYGEMILKGVFNDHKYKGHFRNGVRLTKGGSRHDRTRSCRKRTSLRNKSKKRLLKKRRC